MVMEKIKLLRKTKKLSRKQLSLISGVSESSIRKYEEGTRFPNHNAQVNLAKALEVDETYFYEDAKKDMLKCSSVNVGVPRLIKEGYKIKMLREYCKMPQKDLGVAMGYSEQTAAIRIAQYENGSRKMKSESIKKASEILKCSSMLIKHDIDDLRLNILTQLIWIDTAYPDMLNLKCNANEGSVAIQINNAELNRILSEWEKHKKEYSDGCISSEEYFERKIKLLD